MKELEIKITIKDNIFRIEENYSNENLNGFLRNKDLDSFIETVSKVVTNMYNKYYEKENSTLD